MPVRVWRFLAGFAWVVGSLLLWAAAFDALAYFVFDYLQGQKQIQLPPSIGIMFNLAGGA